MVLMVDRAKFFLAALSLHMVGKKSPAKFGGSLVLVSVHFGHSAGIVFE